MLAMLGAWVGTNGLLNVVLLSSLSGLCIAMILIALKKIQKHKPIPFGPFLAISGWAVVMYGETINQWITQCL